MIHGLKNPVRLDSLANKSREPVYPLEQHKTIEAAYKAMRFTETERNIFYLKNVEELSDTEIATEVGLSESQVSQINRVNDKRIEQFRRLLKK